MDITQLLLRFANNAQIGTLLSRFNISQGSLFHYTNRLAAEGIMNGEVWWTRADSFLDQREVSHGIDVLTDVARTYLSGSDLKQFLQILDALRIRLQSCFVLSLSQDYNNQYLLDSYAAVDGSILEMPENIGFSLNTGWHSVPSGKDSFTNLFINDHYDHFQGFIVYDLSEKQGIAKLACEAYQSLANNSEEVSSDPFLLVDTFQFVNVLMQCLVLFKRPEFEKEKEYRFALVRKDSSYNHRDETRTYDRRTIVFIKTRISGTAASRIQARFV